MWDPLPWGTYGFSSLSMGRDRYAEYAAQRLARSCADKLVHGHLQPGNPASGNEQLEALLASQWEAICDGLGLPAAVGDDESRINILGNWVVSTAFPRETVSAMVTGLVERQLRGYLPHPEDVRAEQWVPILRQAIANRRGAIEEACAAAAYDIAFSWHNDFAERLDQVVVQAVSTLGLPYARALVDQVRRHIDDALAAPVAQLGTMGPADIVALPPQVDAALNALRGVMSNADQVLAMAVDGISSGVRRQLYASASVRVADVMRVMGAEQLGPLRDALGEALILLEQAQAEAATDVGLARLATDQYTAWPADADELVPPRFAEANNEVFLINSTEFKARYETDLVKAVVGSKGLMPFATAVDEATTRVISGEWRTTGGVSAPGTPLEHTATWLTRALGTDPETGRTRVPSMAQFDVHTRPGELLSRARLYVNRPAEAFHEFCKVSLRDFVSGVGASESEVAVRRRNIASKFTEALSLARPLASVNDQALQRLHPGQQVEYRYKFSEIPFAGQAVASALADALRSNPRIDRASKENFGRALSDEDEVTRIDIFGSYPNYSPLAFDSVLVPAAQEWASLTGPGRAGFWRHRRSRPLAASLPMTDAERRTLTAGWFVGQIVGRIRIPAAPYAEPVRIYDDAAARWLNFPHPLLTPPSEFKASYDWLPAVLESMLLAIAQSHEPPVMTSLRPYHALRELFDSTAQDPASGILQLSSVQLLREFIETGVSGPGLESRVATIAATATPADRVAATEEWLTKIRDIAAEYLPAAPGASPDGSFTTITTRSKAAKTPLFWDLAPEVFWATETLIEALHQAATLGDGATVPRADEEHVVIPHGVTF